MTWLYYTCDDCGCDYIAIASRCPACGSEYGSPVSENLPENLPRVVPTPIEVELVLSNERYWKEHQQDLGGGCGC